MDRPWVPALRRLMATKGWSQANLSTASGVRPNTITDLLDETHPSDPRIGKTLAALATGLQVPLWALFCTEHEYALFTERLKQDDAAMIATRQRDAIRADIDAALQPIAEALLAKLTGQPEAPAANPLPDRKPKLAHSAHRPKRRSR